MLTAKQQTRVDRITLLAKTIRKAKSHGRHDGCGNSVINVDLYQQWAQEVADDLEWVLLRFADEVSPVKGKPMTTTERTSRAWPLEGPVDFEELTGPVCRAIRFGYQLERRNKDTSIPWTGLDIGKCEKAAGFSPHDKLHSTNLEYDENEQGRDALEVLVGIAVQLGAEQGRRMAR